MVREHLAQIRAQDNNRISLRQELIRTGLSLVFGAVLGFLAKALDGVSVLGEIGTYLGFWVLAATLIAAWSRSPSVAAVRVFAFFTAMLSSYYLYSMIMFGFFPRYYFLAWGCIALLSPFYAYAIWYARGQGWMAACCAALPVALLLVEGYSFFYSLSVPRGFDLLAAIFLFVVLTNPTGQRLRLLLVTAVVFIVFRQFHVISWLFGWVGA